MNDLIIPWIVNFLSNRRQKVRDQSTLSDWEHLNYDVPQGTQFGSVVFLATIDDACANSSSHKWNYFDDLSLGEVRSVNGISLIQNDINNLYNWSQHNKLKLYPAKCKIMNFCFKKHQPQIPSFYIGENILKVVNKSKLLGVWIQSDLKSNTRVHEMISKGSRRLHILSR